MLRSLTFAVSCLALAVGASACGSGAQPASTATPSSPTTPGTSTPATPATSTTRAQTSTSASAGALAADSRSAATGDIPDNQVFLVYSNHSAGFSIKYPGGLDPSAVRPRGHLQ